MLVVPNMTYVFSGTLNLYSVTQLSTGGYATESMTHRQLVTMDVPLF